MTATTTPQTAQMPSAHHTRRVAVVCESTACLPPALVARYGVGVVPIPFVFGSEQFLDGVDITPAQFYERLVATRIPPKTSPPTPGAYIEVWRAAAGDAGGVVSVTVDGSVSTLQRSARLARELAAEKLPGVEIAIVDSRSAGMGQGFVALAAARAVAEGHPLDEVVAAAERVAGMIRMVVTLDTLDYLARASRIPQVAAFVGGILSIKPIIQFSGGDIRMVSRVRSRRRSIEALLEQMRRDVPEGAPVRVAVQHARAEDEASDLAARVRAEFSCIEQYTTEFTPVMGGYCGPGLLGLAYYVDHIDQAGHLDHADHDSYVDHIDAANHDELAADPPAATASSVPATHLQRATNCLQRASNHLQRASNCLWPACVLLRQSRYYVKDLTRGR